MADIGKKIKDHLAADSAVSALVSDRISSDALPQNEPMPALVYRVISTVPDRDLSKGPSSATNVRMQIDAYAAGRPKANELAEKVRLSLDGQAGDFGGTEVDEVSLDGGIDYDIDPVEPGTGQYRYVSSQDFYIHHQTPTS